MEERLKAYRRQQQRQAFFENIKIRLRNMINPVKRDQEVKIDVDVDKTKEDLDQESVTREEVYKEVPRVYAHLLPESLNTISGSYFIVRGRRTGGSRTRTCPS